MAGECSVLSLFSDCTSPMGMENKMLPDYAITASSEVFLCIGFLSYSQSTRHKAIFDLGLLFVVFYLAL